MQGNLVRDIGECCGVRVSDGSSVSGMGKHAATTQSAISYPDSDVLDLSPVYHPQMMALIVQSGRWARRGEANVRIPSESSLKRKRPPSEHPLLHYLFSFRINANPTTASLVA